jgi:hypothetical protein
VHFVALIAAPSERVTKRTPEVRNVTVAEREDAIDTKCTRARVHFVATIAPGLVRATKRTLWVRNVALAPRNRARSTKRTRPALPLNAAVDVHLRLNVMNPDRRAVADELLAASREHDAGQTDRVARYRNLELGTSNGYSTIWLADAAEAIGAELISVEIDADRSEQARAHLSRASVNADLRVEDAGELLRESDDAAVCS